MPSGLFLVGGPVDVLSDVLQAVRLAGSVFFTAEMTSPWSVASPPPEQLAPALMNGAEWCVLFHVVAEGACSVRVPGSKPVHLSTGDLIIFPHGDAHVMADVVQEAPAPTPVSALLPLQPQPLPPRVEHGGGGERTLLVCGYLSGEDRFDPLARSLPSALCVRTGSTGARIEAHGPAVAEGPGGDEGGEGRAEVTDTWLVTSLQYAVHEATAARPGATSMLGRLAELLFVQVLRTQMEQLDRLEGGWLGGLRDPYVGRAIALMHECPAHDWTVEALARQVGLSRSALASRFVQCLG
ncbi:MAG: cupin domain-containing protein, partial [Myxococcota bacterium]